MRDFTVERFNPADSQIRANLSADLKRIDIRMEPEFADLLQEIAKALETSPRKLLEEAFRKGINNFLV